MPSPEPTPECRAQSLLRQTLHDLSQPLTALECGLFVGTMSPDGVRAPRADELLATILDALAQCERMSNQLRELQARIDEPAATSVDL